MIAGNLSVSTPLPRWVQGERRIVEERDEEILSQDCCHERLVATHEHSRPQRERRSEVVMNRPEGTGDPGGGDQPEIFLERRSGSNTPHSGHKMCMCVT